MHELALAEGVLLVALDAAGSAPVARIEVAVGRLQAVDPASFEFGFRVAAEGTPAEAATLVQTPVALVVRCRGCGSTTRGGDIPACSSCGRMDVEVIEGDELLVLAVETADGTLIRAPSTRIEDRHDEVDAELGDAVRPPPPQPFAAWPGPGA